MAYWIDQFWFDLGGTLGEDQLSSSIPVPLSLL